MARNNQGRVWTPADEATLRDCVSKGMSDTATSALMGVVRTTIEYHRRKLKLKSKFTQARTLPEDFIEHSPFLTVKEAIARWHTSYLTVHAWHAEAGTKPRTQNHILNLGTKRAPRKAYRPAGMPIGLKVPSRAATEAACAQMHLQRYGPCFSARVIDKTAPIGTWVVCGRRLTESEMIAQAKRKGFQPERFAA